MGDAATVTWRALLAETTDAVGERPAARWLCEVASGADRIEDVLDERATRRMVAHLDSMIARHAAGEPLAYVLGRWSFRHLDLAVDRRVLIPRPETEVVAGIAVELARTRPRPVTVADLGTGSGAIGLALADELPVVGVTVWLVDDDPDALDVARANLAGIGRRAANVRIAEGSWFDALPAGTVVDVAVSNPPYVATDRPSSTGPSAGGSRRTRCSPAPTARRDPPAGGRCAPMDPAGRLAGARDRRRSGAGGRGAAAGRRLRRRRDQPRPRRPRPRRRRPPPVIWAGLSRRCRIPPR